MTTQTLQHTGFGFPRFVTTRIDSLREGWARRARYRATLHELSVLSDRDLADLGIARGNIFALAWDASEEEK